MNASDVKKDVVFFEKFGQMIHSGVPIHEALDVLEQEAPDDTRKKLARQFARNVKDGVSLMNNTESLLSYSFARSMIEAGEKRGTLDYILLRISRILEKELLVVDA